MPLIEYSPQYDPFRFLNVDGQDPEEKRRVEAVGDKTWGINDSNFDRYAGAFGYKPEALKDLLEIYIGKDSGNVGLDVAGGRNGRALQQLVAEGFLGKGLVTNYQDKRSKNTKAIETLDHIEGDILERQTWENIRNWQQQNVPEGFSLILHRPAGALQNLRPGFYRGAVHLLIDMTRPNGILLLQIPSLTGGLNRAAYLTALKRSAIGRDDVREVFVTPPDKYDPLYINNMGMFV